MYSKPMQDSEGIFSNLKPSNMPCPKCNKKAVEYEMWESNCGGYEDYHYECMDCGHSWWVEGPDA